MKIAGDYKKNWSVIIEMQNFNIDFTRQIKNIKTAESNLW